MRLLITRFGACGIKQNKLITFVDTNTEKISSVDNIYVLNDSLYSGAGVTYSGNWLCIGVNNYKRQMSCLLLWNFITGRLEIIQLLLSCSISDIVSVFPGQLYLASEGTHSLNNVSFSPDSGELKSDIIHYNLPEHQTEFSSLCSHQMRWYGTTLDSVIELSNSRVVHSGLTMPHSIFFSSHERLCFLELNKFYYGDDIFYFNNNVDAVYEDTTLAGFWVALGGNLSFFNYNGVIGKSISIDKLSVFSMIDVRGVIK